MANKTDPDRRFLQTREWRDRIRPAQLRREPLCRHCTMRGLVVVAEEVDHIIPPRGDPRLQRDFENFQSLCKSCHSAKTRGGNQVTGPKGVGPDGFPIAKGHPWNIEKREGDGMRTADFGQFPHEG
ncbi:MAG: HNH endonuclease [Xanthobacteraceae bacterium]